MSIMECSGHNWRSTKGFFCAYCLRHGYNDTKNWSVDRDWTKQENRKQCKVESENGTLYAVHPAYLPLHKDMVKRETFEYLDEDIGLTSEPHRYRE